MTITSTHSGDNACTEVDISTRDGRREVVKSESDSVSAGNVSLKEFGVVKEESRRIKRCRISASVSA